jgi:hypothetical protein
MKKIRQEFPLRGELESLVYGGVVYQIEKAEIPFKQTALTAGGRLEQTTWPYMVTVYNGQPGVIDSPAGTFGVKLPARITARGGKNDVVEVCVPAEVHSNLEDWFPPGVKGEFSVDGLELAQL